MPFWLLGALVDRGLPLPLRLPASALAFVCPLVATLILVYREDRMDGVWRLLRSIFDYRRIERKVWYVPIVFLLPSIYGLSYVVMRMMGRPLPEPHISILTIPVLLIAFFIGAVGEEVGYTGYVLEPMQEQRTALTAGIVLGLLWGLMHVVPDLQNHHGLAWIAWQRGIYDVALRVLIVWIYNNTGKSVFAAILFHDTDNVSVSSFPNNGSHYDPAVTGVITAITAAVVVFLWGSKTLARYRY